MADFNSPGVATLIDLPDAPLDMDIERMDECKLREFFDEGHYKLMEDFVV